MVWFESQLATVFKRLSVTIRACIWNHVPPLGCFILCMFWRLLMLVNKHLVGLHLGVMHIGITQIYDRGNVIMLHVIQSPEKPNICFTKTCKLGSFSVIQSLSKTVTVWSSILFFFIEERFFQE